MNYGVSIIILRCDTSRCASKQADGNAPSVLTFLGVVLSFSYSFYKEIMTQFNMSCVVHMMLLNLKSEQGPDDFFPLDVKPFLT